jgi:alkyl hydroperoxide reductase subunit AhpF
MKLEARDRRILRRMLSDVTDPVDLLLVRGDAPRDRQAADVLAALAGAVPWAVRPLTVGPDDVMAAAARVTVTPTFVWRHRIRPETVLRYQGAPTGYQFAMFVETLRALAVGGFEEEAGTAEALAGIGQAVSLTIYVSPTCPFSPRAVRVAYALALATPMVAATVVDVASFPEAAAAAGVTAVPHTVAALAGGEPRQEWTGVLPSTGVAERVTRLAAVHASALHAADSPRIWR